MKQIQQEKAVTLGSILKSHLEKLEDPIQSVFHTKPKKIAFYGKDGSVEIVKNVLNCKKFFAIVNTTNKITGEIKTHLGNMYKLIITTERLEGGFASNSKHIFHCKDYTNIIYF